MTKERGPLAVFDRIRNLMSGRTRFRSGMGQLPLVFFLNRQRPRLPDPLDRRTSPQLGLLDSALAKFQLRLALD
jgi:hypothetical protein